MAENALVLTKAQEIAKIEIDMQIATAKMYPRDEMKIISKIQKLATIDDETASECFYVKPVGYTDNKLNRQGKKDELKKNMDNPDLESKFVIGESVRFAEICISQWGNIKIRTYVKEMTESTITATAEAIDLETNIAVSCDVSKSILKRDGGRYSESVIENTKQALQSIAYRNATFKLIPKGLFKGVLNEIKKTSVGLANKADQSKKENFESNRKKAVDFFLKKGVTENQIYDILEISSFDEINENHIMILRGFVTAIKDGMKLEEIFNPDKPETNINEANSQAKIRE